MKNTDITVRKCVYANVDDLNALGELINSYIDDSMGGGERLGKEQQLRLAEALRLHPASIVLLACIGDIRCGLLVAFENFSTFSVRPMINIHDLIVLEKYRGCGIGRSLMNAIIKIAGERLCSRITLEVRKDNLLADRLYKSLGFASPDPAMDYLRKNLPE
jgi:GNAT superfamily N-acetyltransferase